MSQMPPGGPPNYPPYVPPGMQGNMGYSLPAQSKTSGAAVTSLVCGLVVCIPFVTGIVAVITGIVGISTTSNPAVKGRGMAIAGLILGVLSVAGWGLMGTGVWAMVRGTAPQRAFAKQYIADLTAGNVDACVQNSSSQLTKDQIDALSKKAQGWGTLADTMVFAFSVNKTNGNFSSVISGAATFNGGVKHTFAMTLIRESGVFKVDTFQWQN